MTMVDDDRQLVSAAWDDVPGLKGQHFRGSWFSASPERNTAFDTVTYVADNGHELAGGGYPDGLMEGFYVIALLDHLVNEVLFADDPGWSGWNYGLDRVRFVSPLTTHDRFRVRGTVADVITRDDGYLMVLDCTYVVEGRDKPAMVATWRVLWTRES
jgi:hypothetical protein